MITLSACGKPIILAGTFLLMAAGGPSACDSERHKPKGALSIWLTGTSYNGLRRCPIKAEEAKQDLPWFEFNAPVQPASNLGGLTFGCSQDGPYVWNGNFWHVQRIQRLNTAAANQTPILKDVVRVCTEAAVGFQPPRPGEIFPGPCESKAGTGPRGCEICVDAASRSFPIPE